MVASSSSSAATTTTSPEHWRDQKAAKDLYKEAMLGGDPMSCCLLAHCYDPKLKCPSVTPDEPTALRLYHKALALHDGPLTPKAFKMELRRRALELKDADAAYHLGLWHMSGRYCRKDVKRAAYWLEAAHELGHARATAALGTCFKLGKGVGQSLRRASQLFKQASARGFSGALYSLARYLESQGEMSEAMELYEKAANQDCPAALFYLGWGYQHGKHVVKDLAKAAELYKRGADLDMAACINALGYLYQEGDGVQQDLDLAVTCFHRAADMGFAGAIFHLGACYLHGKGVPKDAVKAVELFQQGAPKRHTASIFSLAQCYSKGEGVAQDLYKAVQLYQEAAERGHIGAKNNLAVAFKLGQGVEKDMQKVVDLYRQAAVEGHSAALNNLGYCYLVGEGVVKDVDMAVRLFQQAAQKGQPTSKFYLGQCYLRGEGLPQDEAKALALFKDSAQSGVHAALFMVGRCYECGWGTTKDLGHAVTTFLEAAEKGYGDAAPELKRLVMEDPKVALEALKCKAFNGSQMAIDMIRDCCGPDGTDFLETMDKHYLLHKLRSMQDYQSWLEVDCSIAPTTSTPAYAKTRLDTCKRLPQVVTAASANTTQGEQAVCADVLRWAIQQANGDVFGELMEMLL